MKEKLLVDGYNIIGAWPELRKLKKQSLEMARDRLLEILKEYQAISGKEVIVVFDAYMTSFARAFEYKGPLQVAYTKENETADELIERLVYQALKERYVHVWVATNDFVEQQVTFGEGALRIPARELLQRIEAARRDVRKRVHELENKKSRNRLSDYLDMDVAEILEKWRRK